MQTKYMYQRGFLLITALIYLCILSLLVMTAFEFSIIEQKIANNQRKNMELTLAAEHIIHQVINKIASDQVNSLKIHPPSLPTVLDSAWWQKNAEKLTNDTDQLFYFIEVLAEDGCIHIMDAKVEGARFYRITARAQMQNEDFQVTLQATYAKATAGILSCAGKHTLIQPGIQAWNKH